MFIARSIMAAVTVAFVFGAAPALAKTCKSVSVTGNGTAKNNEFLSKTRAKNNWSSVAVQTYGNGWGIWVISNGKNLTCSRSGPLGNRTWTCAAISRPCR